MTSTATDQQPGLVWSRDTTTIDEAGRTYRVYARRRHTVGQLLLDARAWRARTHVVQDEVRLTFEEHEAAVARLAAWLRDHGLRSGDPLALLARNHAECTIAFWAAHTLGAVVVLGNAWWSRAEAEAAFDQARPALTIVDDDTRAILPTGTAAVHVRELTSMLRGDDRPELELTNVAETAPALVLFTSGTTGAAKGVVLSQRSVVTNIHSLQHGANRLPGSIDPTTPSGTNLVTVPLFHLSGVQVVVAAMLSGATLVYQVGRFDPATVLRLIEQERVTTWGAVPAMVTRVIAHPDFATTDVSSVRSIPVGGSAATPEFKRSVRESFPNLKGGGAGSLYGLTEAGGLLAMDSAANLADRPGSVGRVLPVVDVRIADPDPTSNGEICVRTPGLMTRYLDPAQPSLVDADGWLHTGDLGHVDGDGYLYLTGRKKEIIIRGGENISCAHVEAALVTHPDVVEVAVVGLPHPTLGEQVAAAVTVQPSSSVTVEDLRRHAGQALGRFEVPTCWWLSRTMLPTTPSGKIVRRQVTDAWLARGVGDLVDLES